MRRFALPALVLGIILLCALLVRAPARLLPLLLPAGQVSLQGLSGTLWNGEASRAMLATDAGYLHLGRLQWQLQPFSLLLLAPTLTFDSAWGAQHLSGQLRHPLGGSLQLRNTEGRFGAAPLAAFLPLRLDGEFSLQLQELVLEDNLPERVRGRLVWQDAGWQSPQGMRSLGNYAVELETLEDDTITARVLTLSGDLVAEGSARWHKRSYGVDILLQGPGLDDPQLRQALQLMAAPEGEGFRLKLTGEI